MSRARPGYAVLAVMVISLAPGCAALQGAPTGRGFGPGQAPETLRAEAVVELIGTPEPLAGDGVPSGNAHGEGATVRGRALVLAERPGSFRIEVYGPFNETSVLFVSDGEALEVHAQGASRLYIWGEPHFPYPFSAEEAVLFLVGCGAVTGNAPPCGNPRHEITYGADGLIAEVRGPQDAPTNLKVSFSDFRDVSGFRMPWGIALSLPGQELRIRYAAVEVNSAIRPDFFRINMDRDAAGISP